MPAAMHIVEDSMQHLPIHLTFIALLWSPAGSADCLVVVEQQFTAENRTVGGLAVDWQAQIENRCDAAFDADVTVHFRDAEGASLYTVRDWATLGRREKQSLGKRVYIPSSYAAALSEIDVQVKERARPL
jgi:hypothetical protein